MKNSAIHLSYTHLCGSNQCRMYSGTGTWNHTGIHSCTNIRNSTNPNDSPSKPSFSMSDHYLKKTYAFQSEKEIYIEEIRVDNPRGVLSLMCFH